LPEALLSGRPAVIIGPAEGKRRRADEEWALFNPYPDA
jgi:hypothetical protein